MQVSVVDPVELWIIKFRTRQARVMDNQGQSPRVVQEDPQAQRCTLEVCAPWRAPQAQRCTPEVWPACPVRPLLTPTLPDATALTEATGQGSL